MFKRVFVELAKFWSDQYILTNLAQLVSVSDRVASNRRVPGRVLQQWNKKFPYASHGYNMQIFTLVTLILKMYTMLKIPSFIS